MHRAAYGIALLCAGSCFFDLADPVPVAEGGGGTGSGTVDTGGTGGSAATARQIEIGYTLGEAPGEALVDFPLLVTLPPAVAPESYAPDGADLRFFDSDGETPLAHEIELWDPTGSSIIWVKLPMVSGASGTLLMRYGDPLAAAAPPASAVWSAYDGVYHFADAALVRDSASGAHDGVAHTLAIGAGRIGNGLTFDGVQSWVEVGGSAGFDAQPGEVRSVSIWFARNTTAIATMALARSRNDCCGGWELALLGDQYANVRGDTTTGDCCIGGHVSYNTQPYALPMGAMDLDWHQLFMVLNRAAGNASDFVVYLDGAQVEAPTPLAAAGAMLGDEVAFGVDEYMTGWFSGTLDEVRIGGAASTAWIRASFGCENGDVALTFGDPQPAE